MLTSVMYGEENLLKDSLEKVFYKTLSNGEVVEGSENGNGLNTEERRGGESD